MNKSFYLRGEDFNLSIFDLEQFLLEHSDGGCSSISPRKLLFFVFMKTYN